MRQKGTLILNDSKRFTGDLIGAPLKSSGELVFTTGMVGYSEAITDPSYFGQILVFTYPLIGNYGIPQLKQSSDNPLPKGFESARPHTSGVIVTIDSPEAFHWNSMQSLDSWLEEQGVPGIVGLDTRHLVHLIRSTPNLLGRIEPAEPQGERDMGEHFRELGSSMFFDPGMNDILPAVSTKERQRVGKGSVRIGLVDCGVKWNIVRLLIEEGCEVEIVPWNTRLSEVDVSGWVLSNGPGDPTRTGNLRAEVRALMDHGKTPIFGICLGHQILALAAGATTRRMPFGHRSHNQPVYEVGTRFGYITSQNHGYVVDETSLPEGWEAWLDRKSVV